MRVFPGIYLFLVTHPNDVERVLQTNQHNYRKPDLFNKPVGLLTHSAQSAAERWSELARKNAAIDVADEMMRLTLKIVSLALFSTDISGDADRLGLAVRETFEHVSYRMNHALAFHESVPTRRNRRFNCAKRLLNEMVFGLIDERRRTGEDKGDLLSMLLAARDEDTGEGMRVDHLCDEVMTLILAGHETTGAALSWTWYLLSRNPEARSKLHAELDQVLGRRVLALDDLERLPYTRMVFAESMRLYPPAWGLPRETIGDDTLGGYHIPARPRYGLMMTLQERRG